MELLSYGFKRDFGFCEMNIYVESEMRMYE